MFVLFISKEDTHKSLFSHQELFVSKTQEKEAKRFKYTRGEKSSQYWEVNSAFSFPNNQTHCFFLNARSSVDNLSVYDTASVIDIKAKALNGDNLFFFFKKTRNMFAFPQAGVLFWRQDGGFSYRKERALKSGETRKHLVMQMPHAPTWAATYPNNRAVSGNLCNSRWNQMRSSKSGFSRATSVQPTVSKSSAFIWSPQHWV